MKLYNKVLADIEENTISLTTFDSRFTAGELRDAVSKYEELLRPYNVEGKRIAILVPAIQQFLPLFFAINKLKGTVAPLSWQFRKEDLNNVIDFLNPHIIFTVNEHNGFSFSEVIQGWASEKGNETLIFTSENCSDWHLTNFQGATKKLETIPGRFITFTSGSTGTPKGLIYKEEIMDYSYEQLSKVMNLDNQDNVFVYASTSTVLGIISMNSVLMANANLLVANEFDLVKIIQRMEDTQCNKFITTPSIFKALYNFASKLNSKVLTNLEVVCLVGEKIPDNYVNPFPLLEQCIFVSHYGSSETGAVGNVYLKKDSKDLEYTLINEAEAKSVEGELYVKTGAMFTEYFGNPTLTNEVFEDGWYKMGDLVEFLDDQVFKIIGRKKDIIKKSGQQVVSAEVEQILHRMEEVQSVAVIGAPHEVFGEQIVAFVVSENLTAADIRTYCLGKISSYKVPDKIIFLEELPLNQGKVDKLKLRTQFAELQLT